METHTLISDVSDTSYWVAYYRAKESERPDRLFHDPLAKKLVGDHGKNIADSMSGMTRYTEWSVVNRTVIIDRFIYALVKEGVTTIINLGAGLDARPYRMDLPTELNWIEVDYPQIISHKNKVLKDEKPKCKLTRIELDLTDRKKRQEFFSNIPSSDKVLILTEGVIPYLSPEQVTELGTDLLKQSRFLYWITEYFNPRVYPYLKSAVRTLKMRNAPFLFYPDDWFGFFSKIGWNKKTITYGGEIAKEFKRKPPMPFLFKLLLPFMPKKMKEEAMRMTGYVVLQRS